MPGQYDSHRPITTDFLSTFELYRSLTTADTDPALIDTGIMIFNTKSQTATNNSLLITATAMDETPPDLITYTLYARFPDAPDAIKDIWFLDRIETGKQLDALVLFTALFDAEYKVSVTYDSGGAGAIDVYVSTSVPPTRTNPTLGDIEVDPPA